MALDQSWMGDLLPDPREPELARSAVWAAYSDQFSNYSAGARRNRLAYEVSRVVSLVAAATVTVAAGLSATPWVTATLGALIVVVEGLGQSFQWHVSWVAYRQAAETMRQHAIDFVAGVDAFDTPDLDDRLARLAQIRRDVAMSENGTWARRMRPKTDTP